MTDGRWVNGLHPCVCADGQSGVGEVDASTAVVPVPVPVPVPISATLLVSIRGCVVALVAESKVGANPNTSKDDDRHWNTKFDPFR